MDQDPVNKCPKWSWGICIIGSVFSTAFSSVFSIGVNGTRLMYRSISQWLSPAVPICMVFLLEGPPELIGNDVIVSYFQIGRLDIMWQTLLRGSRWKRGLFQTHNKHTLELCPLSWTTYRYLSHCGSCCRQQWSGGVTCTTSSIISWEIPMYNTVLFSESEPCLNTASIFIFNKVSSFKRSKSIMNYLFSLKYSLRKENHVSIRYLYKKLKWRYSGPFLSMGLPSMDFSTCGYWAHRWRASENLTQCNWKALLVHTGDFRLRPDMFWDPLVTEFIISRIWYL